MVPATLENMRKYRRAPKVVPQSNGTFVTILARQPFAWSPGTGEQFSADPNDYFAMSESDVLEDSDGEPMALVFEVTTYIDADEYEGA